MQKLASVAMIGVFLLAGCGDSSKVSDNKSDSSNSAASTKEGGKDVIAEFVAQCKADGSAPDVEGLISYLADDPGTKNTVKQKYGDLKGKSYCQYFASPEFQQKASQAIGKPVMIQFQQQATGGAYPANSTVLQLEEGDEYYFMCNSVDASGQLGMGGSGVTLEGSSQYGD